MFVLLPGLLGFWLQNRSIMQAQGALAELAKLLPDTATRVVLDGGAERVAEVPVSALREADLVLARPGASIPADGVVRAGSSEVTEAVVTGESRSVPKQPGDRVIAGTVNGSGIFRTRSGVPSRQPDLNTGAAGRSAGAPSGRPASTHWRIRAMESAESRGES